MYVTYSCTGPQCCVCRVEALLHAISKGLLDIVRFIIDHPNYSSEETKHQQSKIFHAEEKYQYSPDITPLMLAAHVYVFGSRSNNNTRSPASVGIANRPLEFLGIFLIFGSNTATWSVENQLHY